MVTKLLIFTWGVQEPGKGKVSPKGLPSLSTPLGLRGGSSRQQCVGVRNISGLMAVLMAVLMWSTPLGLCWICTVHERS